VADGVFRCRNPLLDLDTEDVIIQFGLEVSEGGSELCKDFRVERKPVPVLAFPVNPDASTYEVDVKNSPVRIERPRSRVPL
jgi:hypothetical protein